MWALAFWPEANFSESATNGGSDIQGPDLESLDIIEENDEGIIVDRTLAFRPMPAAKLFRDAMRSALGSSVPDDFWDIQIRNFSGSAMPFAAMLVGWQAAFRIIRP